MNEIEINKDSWHYRLATYYSWSKSSYRMNDLCTYITNVSKGFFVVSISTAFISFILSSINVFLIGVYVAVTQGTTLSSVAPPTSYNMSFILYVCGISICILIATALSSFILSTLIKNTTLGLLRNGDRLINIFLNKYNNLVEKNKLIVSVYDSIKNKVCYKIKFIGK